MRAKDRRRGWKVRHRGDAEGGGEGKGLRPTGALRSGISRSLPRVRALLGCGDSKSASPAKVPEALPNMELLPIILIISIQPLVMLP